MFAKAGLQMTAPLKLPDGWHKFPGDGRKDSPNRRSYGAISCSDSFYGSGRYFYWAFVLNGEIIAMNGFAEDRGAPRCTPGRHEESHAKECLRLAGKDYLYDLIRPKKHEWEDDLKLT